MRKLPAATLIVTLPLSVLAQAPAPAPVPITIEQERAGDPARQPVQRPASSRPGFAPPPMNIRIRDEGIKLPACTAESREGEACKK